MASTSDCFFWNLFFITASVVFLFILTYPNAHKRSLTQWIAPSPESVTETNRKEAALEEPKRAVNGLQAEDSTKRRVGASRVRVLSKGDSEARGRWPCSEPYLLWSECSIWNTRRQGRVSLRLAQSRNRKRLEQAGHCSSWCSQQNAQARRICKSFKLVHLRGDCCQFSRIERVGSKQTTNRVYLRIFWLAKVMTKSLLLRLLVRIRL